LDEPNTGPFCLMRTQPCAHALGVGIIAATNAAAAKNLSIFTDNPPDETHIMRRAFGRRK